MKAKSKGKAPAQEERLLRQHGSRRKGGYVHAARKRAQGGLSSLLDQFMKPKEPPHASA